MRPQNCLTRAKVRRTVITQSAEQLYRQGEAILSQGRVHEAARKHAASLDVSPTHLNAAIRFGNYLLFQNNPESALAIFESALAAHKSHPILSRGRLFALKDMRKTNAGLSLLETLGSSPDLALTRGQLLAQRGDIEAARTNFENAIATPATAVTGIKNILQTAHLATGKAGLVSAYQSLMSKYSDLFLIPLLGADFFREAGLFDEAFACLKAHEDKFPSHPEADQIRASVHIDLGEGALAFRYAKRAVEAMPGNPVSLMRLSQAALMTGRREEALQLSENGMAADPYNSFWPAIKASSLKSLGRDDAYAALTQIDATIKVYELEDVAGYDSADQFLSQLKATLHKLHGWKSQPLAQSVRGGTQTSWDLRFNDDPIIQTFFAAMRPFVADYIAGLPENLSHPFLSRKSKEFYFSGAWSILLRGEGYHVNHIHPDGWLSSAFYVDVPDSVQSGTDKSGWIGFGEPPFELNGGFSDMEIRPVRGRLVLFPSFMWHGTRKFSGDQTRLTLPFDVRPAFK